MTRPGGLRARSERNDVSVSDIGPDDRAHRLADDRLLPGSSSLRTRILMMDEKKSSTHRLAQGLGILLAALALLVQGRLLLAALLKVLILPLGSLLALTHGEEMSQVADQVCRSSAIGLLPLEA